MRHVFATNETVEVITLEICEECEFANFQSLDREIYYENKEVMIRQCIECSLYRVCIRAMEETQKLIDKD